MFALVLKQVVPFRTKDIVPLKQLVSSIKAGCFAGLYRHVWLVANISARCVGGLLYHMEILHHTNYKADVAGMPLGRAK